MTTLLPLMFLTTFVFFLSLNKVNSIESTSFSFTKFMPVPLQPNLIFQGDAGVTPLPGNLYLTEEVNYSTGRALYAAPVQIWDKRTGQVASFVTSFSFIMYSADLSKTGDGLAFFLAPVDTQPQQPGGLLGLFPDRNVNKSNQVVAVEFDSYSNPWDPQGTHIGIDVNGIESVKTTPLDFKNEDANAVISYDASTKVLSASLVYPYSQKSYFVSSVVDLKDVLPEFVRVGFSATTGLSEGFKEGHFVFSWSFESKLPSRRTTNRATFNNAHASSHGLDSSI